MADDAAWQAAMDVLLAASEQQARDASLEAAEDIGDRTKELLSMQFHAPHTKTPSAPGTPPALITGALMESVTAMMVGPDEAWVGPTSSASSYNGPYGRIQELGGGMHGHPLMRWTQDGVSYEAEFVELPKRPSLKPATESAVDDGTVYGIYVNHQLIAILEATG